MTIALYGTTEQLQSPKALKVLAATRLAGLTVECRTGKAPGASNSLTPPLSKQDLCFVLSEDGNSVSVGTTYAALLLVARLAPATCKLLGSGCPIERARVESWLSFVNTSIEFPLQVGATGDVEKELQQVDAHLLYHTYIAGTTAISLADISLAVSLKDMTLEKTPNLQRWYDTISHQPWFEPSGDGAVVARSLPAVAAAPSGQGVQLQGIPTPVVNHKYRRNRIRIKEILENGATAYMDQTVTVCGWARTIRKASSKLFFVQLNDGSTGASLQCVLDIQSTAGFDDCKNNGGTGSSFTFVGKIVPSAGSEQLVDMQVTDATMLGAVYGGNPEGTVVGGMLYPMAKKEHTLEHMRDNAHLRARGQIHAAAMRIRHAMAFATHNFFNNHGFLYIHTPIITGADCEGAGEQFAVTTLLGNDHHSPTVELPKIQPPEEKKISKSEMKKLAKKKGKGDPNKPEEQHVVGAVDYYQDFFAQRVNLTVSGQLNVETHACALSDVYTFGPTFRAEVSRTYRHLSEFWMIEPEICFANLSDDIDLAEDYLKYCVQYALENCAEDLEFFENNPHGEKGLRDRLRNVLENEFKRLTYTEAIDILKKGVEDGVEFEVKPEWGIDLPSEHERYICEKVFKQPVVLTDYPKEIKAFYMKLNEDGKTVAAADVLVPKIGEIIGGSQREHRLDVLKERCLEMNLDPRALWWYLDLRRYGTVPHAGFGLGFERLILFITGLDNIRDVIPFPRWVGNAKF